MDDDKRALNGEDLDWFLLNGEGKSFDVRITLNRKPDRTYQETPITLHIYFVDDDKLEDKPIIAVVNP